MICYRDRTFCASEVTEHTCGREFTEQDAIDAEKVAELIGGTLIAVNGDVALIVGGDLSKLKVGTE